MGCPQPLQVYGQSYRETGSYYLTLDDIYVPADLKGKSKTGNWAGDCDDLALATIRLADGTTLRVEMSWALNNEKHQSYTELYGTKAGAKHNPLTIYGEEPGLLFDKTYQVPEQTVVRAHALAVRHFLDCIHSGHEPITTGEQIVTLARMLDAIGESSKTGKRVEL